MPFKMKDGQLVKITQAEADAIAGPVSEPVPVPAITYKADIWRRCTDDEANLLDQALQVAPVRLRKLFEHALHVSHDDAQFAMLQQAITATLGAERAAVILAPSEA